MITFAGFHIDLDATVLARIHTLTASVTVVNPLRMLSTMLASAERSNPGCRKVVLTDRKTSFSGVDVEPVRLDIDPTLAMLSRFRAWSLFCSRADSHVAFLDSDILVCADLAHVFEDNFDVALTYRAWQVTPINAGVVFAHGGSLTRATRFYETAFERNRTDYPNKLQWAGNQETLRDMTDRADYSRSDSFIHEQCNFRVKLLPCSTYNFSTPDERMNGSYPHAKILHFKGRRKDDMIPCWERISSRTAGAVGSRFGRLLDLLPSWTRRRSTDVG